MDICCRERKKYIAATAILALGCLLTLGLFFWYKSFAFFTHDIQTYDVVNPTEDDSGQMIFTREWLKRYYETAITNNSASDIMASIYINGSSLESSWVLLQEDIRIARGEEYWFDSYEFAYKVVISGEGITEDNIKVEASTLRYLKAYRKSVVSTMIAGILLTAIWALLIVLMPEKIKKYGVKINMVMACLLSAGSIVSCLIFYRGYYENNLCFLALLCANFVVALKLFVCVEERDENFKVIANLKRNWYFPISTAALYFCWEESALGFCSAFLVSVIISSQIPSIFTYVKKSHITIHIISLLGAIGICEFRLSNLSFVNWSTSSKNDFDLIMLVHIITAAIIGVFFAYFCLIVFWRKMTEIIIKSKIFYDIKMPEFIVYAVLLIVSLAFVAVSFNRTIVFYGGGNIDNIYTSDSSSIVEDNAYLSLTHPENDLRQPLFAVFSAPFVGIPYFFARLFKVSSPVQAMLINSVQIVLLFSANFLLAKMMKLSPAKRICFMLLIHSAYTSLLFTLMMEQYIIAYFWLVFCMYLIAEDQKSDRLVIWAAGGTLLTNLVLMPFMSEKSPIRKFKEWFMDMVKYGCEFIMLLLIFCRFDVIFGLRNRISFLMGYTGRNLTIREKTYQYANFIRCYFIAPDAGVKNTGNGHISWQLNAVNGISIAGVVILLLSILSAFLNRDKKSSLFTVSWLGFSVIMLWGLGWGTKENGLILYALYFGWPFMVLLFQLIEKITDKLNKKFLLPVICVGCIVVLALINIPAFSEMLDFAVTYYPVKGVS